VVGLAQGLGGLADLALAGQEHQHVAGAAALRLVDRIDQRVVEVAVLVLARPFGPRLRGAAWARRGGRAGSSRSTGR
jgi:hypothetical protein